MGMGPVDFPVTRQCLVTFTRPCRPRARALSRTVVIQGRLPPCGYTCLEADVGRQLVVGTTSRCGVLCVVLPRLRLLVDL